jgi:uncharacterized protein (DUF2252 family)
MSTAEDTSGRPQGGSRGGARRARGGSKTPPKHPSVAERAAIGKAARAEVPRSSHAGFEPSSDRPDPIALLEGQAVTRVPELVPIRYGRMLTSSFAFFRGSALIMASDLSQTPTSGLRVQLCGDAHLSNFGVFASAERSLVFDINDFDETLPGPWEWDVKRLAASLAVAGRQNGYTAKERDAIVRASVAAYREAMRSFAGVSNLTVWYARKDVDELLAEGRSRVTKSMIRRTEKTVAKARTSDSLRAFSKLTHEVDGERRIIANPPLIEPIHELLPSGEQDVLYEQLRDMVRSYSETLRSDRRILLEQFRLVDVARKVVGVGSVGTRAWIVLMLGRDGQDALFLQVKEAQPSVLAEFVGGESGNDGKRVVDGQHLMQASSDIFLGWVRVKSPADGKERDFYVRQLKDWKGSAEVEVMVPLGMQIYAELCGWTLARAHARSGDRVAIASYLGSGDTFDRALSSFAEAYADQNERDYQALVDAAASGRITATEGI